MMVVQSVNIDLKRMTFSCVFPSSVSLSKMDGVDRLHYHCLRIDLQKCLQFLVLVSFSLGCFALALSFRPYYKDNQLVVK